MAPRPLDVTLALDPKQTPFDYIVVGSGAGGGPLAARLALSGKRVLVLEAGLDPAVAKPEPGDPTTHPDLPDPECDKTAQERDEPRRRKKTWLPTWRPRWWKRLRGIEDVPREPQPEDKYRDVTQVPAYHGPATEDPDMSWTFSVRHYADDQRQQDDTKYDPSQDRSSAGGPKGGIQYPRSSALGGCTAHHAMIVVKPNDRDWNAIARRTGDEQWGADVMQGYFARIENCLYYTSYDGYFRQFLGAVYDLARKLVTLVNPRYQLDWGGHGFTGWQKTSFIDPVVIAGIVWRDWTFVKLLLRVFKHLLLRRGRVWALKESISRLRVIQSLDPNFRSARGAHGQLAFIPIGTDGQRRTGVREHLLRTAQCHPDRLVIHTGVLATRVVFEAGTAKGEPPRAVGVEVHPGPHAYDASPLHQAAGARRVVYYARQEIVLAGGAFNTPQLLMLSGIGDQAHLADHGIQGPRDAAGKEVAPAVHLPGVGQNLQDRYEVSVISETDKEFSTLKGVSFDPDDPKDPALVQWKEGKGGLYSTNGGALAVFAKSQKQMDAPDPDLFIFGVPAAFRGYYWNWSKELLWRAKGRPEVSRKLWSWIILKAYTRNNRGTVRLHSGSAFEQPEICFHSFRETAHGLGGTDQARVLAEAGDDLAALADGVAFVRELNGKIRFQEEIQPGPAIRNASPELTRWIEKEAWGHHACGTARMGSDPWQPDPALLRDTGAVLDSRFRVHGVARLRVVDASVFPEIPGYFIVTPIFMVGEKGADVLLADSEKYPQELETAEAAAIATRRARANQPAGQPAAPGDEQNLPPDTVGVAFSGGGIRSATYCLGFLQALAARGRLRNVDILSTVSGGGYIGAFLGRLYTRLADGVSDRVARVQEKLTTHSAELFWLRTHANYLSGEGRTDVMTNLAAVWRNLLGIHICIGILMVAAFSLLRWVSGDVPSVPTDVLGYVLPIALSPWWWLPLLVLAGVVAPIWFGFWIAPWPGLERPPILPLVAWMALLAGAVAGLRIPGGSTVAMLAIGVLLLAWVAQELSQWQLRPGTQPRTYGLIARNRLTRAQATSLVWLTAATLWFLLDTAARSAAHQRMMPPAAGTMAAIALVLPFLRQLASRLTARSKDGERLVSLGKLVMGGAALTLAAFLLFALDVIAHTAFDTSPTVGTWLFWVTLGVSLALGRALGFANLASLQPLYSARLVRTFLGASNESRLGGGWEARPTVEAADSDDDIDFNRYHPEEHGGPLHLINVCVNETVDAASGRHLRQDKGLSMCVGPCGLSVGLRYHSLWSKGGRARPLRVSSDPQSFHVLARGADEEVNVERLRLGQWMGISGAALATGAGRLTSLPLSLLLGLLNARLGYWWDTRIKPGARPGRYPPTLVRRIKGLPGWVFRAQGMILNEWRSYFGGPSQRLWYLSDGGHFENTGLYELVRRRPALIIAVDAGQDQDYRFEDVALLVRRARMDFGANFRWVEPAGPVPDWKALQQTLGTAAPPAWIQDWIDPKALGQVWKIQREGTFTAALARVTYDDDPQKVSWLLVVKAGVMPDLPLDVTCYSKGHPAFPNQSTFDQFLDDDQWESYRLLGEHAGKAVLA
jgi:choline dehydrogenase-like flavoprotein